MKPPFRESYPSINQQSSKIRPQINHKSTKNRLKIVEKSLRRRCANEPRETKSIFSLPDATWRRFWSPRGASGRFRAPFLASRGALGKSPDAPRARRGRPKTLPRRSRDAIGMLLVAMGRPERLPGPVLSRFGVPRAAPGTDFASSFVSICASIFVRILRASWPANGRFP